MNYGRLLAPLSVASHLTLKNRLVMAPMTTVSGETDGRFSLDEIAYLEKRAQSDIGLIITPACYCHQSGQAFENQVGCHCNAMLPRLTQCADAINRHGAASFLQIHHGGNATRSSLTGRPPMAPSAVINRRGTSEMPIAMTEDEIWLIIESFARAAGRAKAAGFTGIELHGANSYLFQQFFSPFTNHRTDRWGGDCQCATCDRHAEHDRLELCHRLENRARFAIEVLKAVRSEVGREYPVAYRISPEEPAPDGYSTRDAVQLLGLLLPHGIDIVHVSSWQYGVGVRNDLPADTNPTNFVRASLPLQIPVIGVGGVLHPDQALAILDDGIELVALGRALLLDPDWLTKVTSGRLEEIKMNLRSEDERATLDIPLPMRGYTRHSISISH